MDLDPLRSATVATIQAAGTPRLSEVWGDIDPATRTANLKARLTTADGSPIAGVRLRFRIGPDVVGSAVTNADGLATLNGARLGNLPLRGYIARTIAVLPAGSGFPRMVRRGPLAMPRPIPTPTSTVMSGVSAAGTFAGSADFSATLMTSTNAPISGKTVRFLVGNQVVGTALTGSNGVAVFHGASPTSLNAGTYAMSAVFDGDTGSAASNGTGSLDLARATASIVVGSQTTTYNGLPAAATATTSPVGLSVVYAYADGDGHAVSNPTNAGVYQVAATISDPNYVGSATGSLTIHRATLGVSGLVVSNKLYDGTTAATLDTTGAMLTGLAAGDVVSLDTTAATAAFDSKNAGVGKTVAISGLALTGPAAGNYLLPTIATTATISPRALQVSGVTALDKVYDGTATASLDVSAASLVGVIPGDSVSLDASASVGSFADKNVGTGKVVTINGLVMSGPDAGNYQPVSSTTVLADVTPAPLTIAGITAQNKVYDGTIAATPDFSGMTLSGLIAGDDFTVDTSSAAANYLDKNVGAGKIVLITGLAISGADVGNYAITTAPVLGTITPSSVTLVSPVSATSKIYDGTNSASVSVLPPVIIGAYPGDTVWIDPALAMSATGTFDDKNVGADKEVTIHGLALTGPDAGNYVLNPVTVTASITPAPLTVTGATALDKVYDGNTDAVIDTSSASLSGVIGGDVVTLGGLPGTGSFSDKNAGESLLVTITGLSLGGADAGNYTLVPATATASITPAPLTVTGITAYDKVYDANTIATINAGSATLVGVIGTDVVTLDTLLALGAFADKNVGVGKTVTITGLSLGGADAGNYMLNPVTATATITQALLNVLGTTASSKVYDGNTTATVDTSLSILAGVIGADVVTLDGSLATGAFTNKNVGTGKTVLVSGLTLGGPDAGNYSIIPATAAANITPATLTVSGITAGNKVYDGNTDATINLTGISVSGLIGSDDVTIDSTLATGAFADKNVGVNKTVTVSGLSLIGVDAGNYTISPDTTTASITPRSATLTTPVMAYSKTYDGTTAATVSVLPPIVSGVLPGDSAWLDMGSAMTATGTFADKNVGAGKTVTIHGLFLSGPDAGNYTLDPVTTTADVTPAALVVSGITADDKVYDGTTGVTTNYGGAMITGLVGGDTASLDYSGAASSFADKNVDVNKVVTITGLVLTGSLDLSNYTVTYSPVTATITKKMLTVTGIPDLVKVADGDQYFNTVDTSGAGLSGILVGDLVTLNLLGTIYGEGPSSLPGTYSVTIYGLTLDGADAGNYGISDVIVNGTITP